VRRETMEFPPDETVRCANDANPGLSMVQEINLDPLGVDKYDRIMEKYNRVVSTTMEDTDKLALLRYDSGCLQFEDGVKTHKPAESVVVSEDDNIEIQMMQCSNPSSVQSVPFQRYVGLEKDAAVIEKLKPVRPKKELLAETRQNYYVKTQNNSVADTKTKSTRRVQVDPPEECADCAVSSSSRYTDVWRDYTSSSRASSVFVASRDDYGSFKSINEKYPRDDDAMLFDNARTRVNSRLEVLNAKSRAFKARLERGEFGENSLVPSARDSKGGHVDGDRQSSGNDDNEFISRMDEIKNKSEEVKHKPNGHDTESTNLMDRRSVCFSEYGVYRDDSGADKSVLLSSGNLDTNEFSLIKHGALRSNLLPNGKDPDKTSKKMNEFNEIKEHFQQSALKSPKLSKDLATKVLSEKILRGHMMTRSNCARCGVPLLLSQESAVVCVCCPLMRLRSDFRQSVAKRELVKMVADGNTVCHGNLCRSCHSPKVIRSGDEVCLVCPVLDNAIIAFLRAESKGFALAESFCDCGARKMKNRSGIESCVVCSPMKMIAFKDINVVGKEDEMEAEDDNGVVDAVSFNASMKSMSSMDTAVIKNLNMGESSERMRDLESNSVSAATDDADKEDKMSARRWLKESKQELIFNIQLEAGTDTTTYEKAELPGRNRIEPTHLAEQQLQEAQVQINIEPEVDGCVEKEKKMCESTGAGTLVLESETKSIQHNSNLACSSNIATGVSTLAALQEQLRAEIEKAKQWQAALDKTIEKPPEAEMTIPDIGVSKEANAIGNPDSIHSYSISQQEVEKGVMKEYFPPKLYFFHKGIPSEVFVDNLQAESVAQSYHTNHLKNTQKINATTSNISDCLGISSSPKKVTFDVKEEEGFDDETIQTDEDTADYTWNTLDDSMEDTVQGDYGLKKNVEKAEKQDSSEPKGLCYFLECFSCGRNPDESSPVDQEQDNFEVPQDNVGNGTQPPNQTETVHRVPLIYGDSYSLASTSREKGMKCDPPSEMSGSSFDHRLLVRDDSGLYTDTECSTVQVDTPERLRVNPHCTLDSKSSSDAERDAILLHNNAEPIVEVQQVHQVEKDSDFAAMQMELPNSLIDGDMVSGDRDESESVRYYNDMMHLISQNQSRETGRSSAFGCDEAFEPQQHTMQDWDSNSATIESVGNDSFSLNTHSEPQLFLSAVITPAGVGAAKNTSPSVKCEQRLSFDMHHRHGWNASMEENDPYEIRDKYSVLMSLGS